MPSLAQVGSETVEIVRRGEYEVRPGSRVSIADAARAAVAGSRLYRPDDFAALSPRTSSRAQPATLEVTGETTGEAARRLVEKEGARVVALNFASARNPGGGFLKNAKAQEEDLARCSALYACLAPHEAYYKANRAFESLLYTDHLIYSPDVPFFRNERLELIEPPFVASIITSPAPNAGEAAGRGEGHLVRATLERRAEQVLRVAAHHEHDVLLLGAWGCGVFRNDPRAVADVFARLLTMRPYSHAFARVVFPVYDRSAEKSTLRAFEERMRGG